MGTADAGNGTGMIYVDERLALYIDGWNLHSSARALGFEIDFKSLLAEFMRLGKLVSAAYYTALNEHEDSPGVRPLIDWLSYNGFTVVTRTAVEVEDSAGRRRFRGRIDLRLAVDAMEMSKRIDHAVLFSGDGAFRPPDAALQRRRVRVTVVSSIRTGPPMIADELRRQADNFIELDELRERIERVRSGEGGNGDPAGTDS
jgi:uncharacterized LabA/DUF88 family protein